MKQGLTIIAIFSAIIFTVQPVSAAIIFNGKVYQFHSKVTDQIINAVPNVGLTSSTYSSADAKIVVDSTTDAAKKSDAWLKQSAGVDVGGIFTGIGHAIVASVKWVARLVISGGNP